MCPSPTKSIPMVKDSWGGGKGTKGEEAQEAQEEGRGSSDESWPAPFQRASPIAFLSW